MTADRHQEQLYINDVARRAERRLAAQLAAPKCLRCGKPARFLDTIDTPFCPPCARRAERAAPDLLPMRPIEPEAQS